MRAALRLMRAEKAWGHDPVFEYEGRWRHDNGYYRQAIAKAEAEAARK